MSEFRVFISHKADDHATAMIVKSTLEKFSGDLQFFVSGHQIAGGEDWQERLRQELRDSDLLLLLFTEPAKRWDWCLYEVGLFERLDEENEPVVCLHNGEGGPPEPLKGLQSVAADVDTVSRFLNDLIRETTYTKRERALNANVSDDDIRAAAEEICDQFAGNIKPYYASFRAHLALPSTDEELTEIPRDAVVSGSTETMRLFGRTPDQTTWGELLDGHLEREARWVREIDQVFGDACNGKLSSPTTFTFIAHDGVRIIRPELYRLDRRGKRPVGAVVVFTQEVAPSIVGGPVFNRLRICERYQSEVFDHLRSSMDTELCARLREVLDLIKEDAEAHNVFDEESFESSFPDPDVQAQLRDVVEKWSEHTAALEALAETGDEEAVAANLTAMAKLTANYRKVVAHRYAELVQ